MKAIISILYTKVVEINDQPDIPAQEALELLKDHISDHTTPFMDEYFSSADIPSVAVTKVNEIKLDD